MSEPFKADIIVGAGLSGMVAAHEAVLRGRKVLLLDQEAPQSLGGQAFWSLGGLFMVDTPEQRRLGIRDSAELALSDRMGSAQASITRLRGLFWAVVCFLGVLRGSTRKVQSIFMTSPVAILTVLRAGIPGQQTSPAPNLTLPRFGCGDIGLGCAASGTIVEKIARAGSNAR